MTEKEYRKLKRLPIKDKVELLKQEKHIKAFLHRKGNIPLKKYLINNNLYIDELKNSKEKAIQLELVRKGHFHDILKNSKYEKVRMELANLGKFLHIYKNDTSWRVRMLTAKKGVYNKKYLSNITLQQALIWRYLNDNYKENMQICIKCNKCRRTFYDHSLVMHNTHSNFWFENEYWFNKRKEKCPYQMEHTVLAKGFMKATTKELLNKAIIHCNEKYNKNKSEYMQKM